MEAFLFSTFFVALAEMGDKTQLLAILLAARYRKPWPIIAGILVATLLNHALAGAVGALISQWIGPDALRWILGIAFLIMAVWLLIPDKIDAEEKPQTPRWGVFGSTVLLFFLAEMGDKTQIATVGLAARFDSLFWVVAGTTLGMMLSNAPAVWFGEAMTRRIPIAWIHGAAAALFAGLGLWVLIGT
jgi:putative Ca2+/H+ antiporter (TMEM165/GDT1 family)